MGHDGEHLVVLADHASVAEMMTMLSNFNADQYEFVTDDSALSRKLLSRLLHDDKIKAAKCLIITKPSSSRGSGPVRCTPGYEAVGPLSWAHHEQNEAVERNFLTMAHWRKWALVRRRKKENKVSLYFCRLHIRPSVAAFLYPSVPTFLCSN